LFAVNIYAMHYTPNTLFLDSSVPYVDLSVGVFIAYEDIAAGKRAKETCDILAENLGEDWKLRTQVANLKSLGDTRLRRIASVEASKTNIIMVSSHDGPMGPGVKQWIRMVVSRGPGPMALVSLFSCPRQEARFATEQEAFLADMAKQGRMQFFSRFGQSPAFQWEWPGRMGLDFGQAEKRIYL
jgi:hypothetical protein